MYDDNEWKCTPKTDQNGLEIDENALGRVMYLEIKTGSLI